MPERRPPERRPPHEPTAEDEHAPFLDGPEPDWVERLHQNRKAQVKRWERVFGTGDHDAAGDGPADRTSEEAASARRGAPASRDASRKNCAYVSRTPSWIETTASRSGKRAATSARKSWIGTPTSGVKPPTWQ